MKVDQPLVRTLNVASEDTQGNPFELEGVIVPVMIPGAEIAALLASYDPENQYSPAAAEARAVCRLVLDALKAYTEG
jgi:hypothetical protein